jgi:hypothetical protein
VRSLKELEKPVARCSVGRCPAPAALSAPRPSATAFEILFNQLPTRTCFSNKLSNSYLGLTLDLSTKFIGQNQAIVWKACHTVISAHGDKLWRTQEFFWTKFAIAEPQEFSGFVCRSPARVGSASFKITVGNPISRINNVTDCIKS